jgi:hypothetical protein
MARKKKYAEGGLVVDERDLSSAVGPQSPSFSGAGVELEAAARRGEAVREAMRRNASKVADAPKRMSFNEAFAAARRRGDKTFSWNGGSYGTKLKGEDAPAPAKRATEPAPAKREAPARAAAPAPTKRAADPTSAKRAADPTPDRAPTPRATVGLSNSPRLKAAIDSYVSTVSKERAAARSANQAKVESLLRAGRPTAARAYAAIAEGADFDAARRRVNPPKPTPPRSRAVDDKVGLMLQRPPPLLRMKTGGSVKKPTATKLVRKK